MMKKILTFTILLNLFSSGYSQVDFTRVTQTIGSDLEVVDIGDIKNDGLNDVVIGASGFNPRCGCATAKQNYLADA